MPISRCSYLDWKNKERGRERSVGAKPKVFSLIPPRSCVFSDLAFTSCVDIARILFHADALPSHSVSFLSPRFLRFPLILTRISLDRTSSSYQIQRLDLLDELFFYPLMKIVGTFFFLFFFLLLSLVQVSVIRFIK